MGIRSISTRLLAGAALMLGLCVAGAQASEEFLDPVKAFVLSARQIDAGHLEVRFDVAPGYYLYRDKLTAVADDPSAVLGELQVPRGQVKFDETFGKDVETLRNTVTLVLPVPPQAAATTFQLDVGNQGCADKGLCYPPQRRPVRVEAGPAGLLRVAIDAPPEGPRAGGLLSTLTSPAMPAASAPPPGLAPEMSADAFGRVLQSRNLFTVAGAFLLAGLLLSLTPCVLPMLPILSSIIVGQSERGARTRGFSLAFAYSMGMAIVYTLFGIAAALIGSGLGAALQNAWVLGAFALLLAVLSLSMFGAFDLQVPAGLQARFTAWSNRFHGGRHAGVFIMGGLSAVIVGPCVAAPLAGALVYISQTRDTLLGGVALFSMAAGMSVPLLLVGASAGALLPRTGAWMRHVKHLFGFLLLAVALWMVTPVLPPWLVMLVAAVLLLGSGVYLGAFEPLHVHATHPGRTLAKGLGIGLALLAALELVGVASGGRNLLQPLQHLGVAGGPGRAGPGVAFTPVASLAALDEAVRMSTKPVMLDVYADWCVSCKEFEAFTLTDPQVQDKLARMNLLRIDVTANTPADQALLRRHGLFGPPAMLFFPPAGEEITQARVIGFQSAPTFLEHLARIEPLARAR